MVIYRYRRRDVEEAPHPGCHRMMSWGITVHEALDGLKYELEVTGDIAKVIFSPI